MFYFCFVFLEDGAFFCLASPFFGHNTSLLSPLSIIADHTPSGGGALKIFNSAGLVAVAKACSDRAGWLQRSRRAPGCVCERNGTGRNEETAMSILPKWEKQTFLLKPFQFFFPPNSFPPANLPTARRNIEPDKSVFLRISQPPPSGVFTETAVN